MLLAIFFTEMASWGVLYYVFTVFLEPMQRSLGWSTAELTGALSLALLWSGIAALPFGRWLDRYGSRLLMTTGSGPRCLPGVARPGGRGTGRFEFSLSRLGIAVAAA